MLRELALRLSPRPNEVKQNLLEIYNLKDILINEGLIDIEPKSPSTHSKTNSPYEDVSPQ